MSQRSEPGRFEAKLRWQAVAEVGHGLPGIGDNGSDDIYRVEDRDEALLIDTGRGAQVAENGLRTRTPSKTRPSPRSSDHSSSQPRAAAA